MKELRMKNLSKIATSMLLCGALAGCGDGLAEAFGFKKSTPDEFNVVTRPPLIMPPEYNLRPPGSEDARPPVLTGTDLARGIAFGVPAVPQTVNATEAEVLAKASDGKTYGDGIREQIEMERQGTASETPEIIQQLVKDAESTAQ